MFIWTWSWQCFGSTRYQSWASHDPGNVLFFAKILFAFVMQNWGKFATKVSRYLMVNEIFSVSNEIGELKLILGQLTWYEIANRCALNYRVPDQEIRIVGYKGFLTAFGLGSLENKAYVWVVSWHSHFMCLYCQAWQIVLNYLSFEFSDMIKWAMFFQRYVPDVSDIKAEIWDARREALASPAKFPQHSWLLVPPFAMSCSGATVPPL